VAVIHILGVAFKFFRMIEMKIVEYIELIFHTVAIVKATIDFLQILFGEPDIAAHFPAPGRIGRG
jgi:hypothetical protein